MHGIFKWILNVKKFLNLYIVLCLLSTFLLIKPEKNFSPITIFVIYCLRATFTYHDFCLLAEFLIRLCQMGGLLFGSVFSSASCENADTKIRRIAPCFALTQGRGHSCKRRKLTSRNNL